VLLFAVLAVSATARLVYEDTHSDESDVDVEPPMEDIGAGDEEDEDRGDDMSSADIELGNDCLTPQCGGFVAGIVHYGAANNCSFVQLDLESGATHILTSIDVCKDHRNGQAPGAPVTSYDNPTKSILFANGDGNNIYQIKVQTGVATELASLPAKYKHLIGLAVAFGMGANGQWYLVTDSALYLIQSGASSPIFDVSALQLSTDTRVVAYNDTLYLADGLKLHAIDLLNLQSTTTTIANSELATATTLDFWLTKETLTMIDSNRNVYSVSPSTGASTVVMTLPAGQGVVARSALFGDMYFPCDDTSMMVSNLAAQAGEGALPFPGSSTQGNFQYYY